MGLTCGISSNFQNYQQILDTQDWNNIWSGRPVLIILSGKNLFLRQINNNNNEFVSVVAMKVCSYWKHRSTYS